MLIPFWTISAPRPPPEDTRDVFARRWTHRAEIAGKCGGVQGITADGAGIPEASQGGPTGFPRGRGRRLRAQTPEQSTWAPRSGSEATSTPAGGSSRTTSAASRIGASLRRPGEAYASPTPEHACLGCTHSCTHSCTSHIRVPLYEPACPCTPARAPVSTHPPPVCAAHNVASNAGGKPCREFER